MDERTLQTREQCMSIITPCFQISADSNKPWIMHYTWCGIDARAQQRNQKTQEHIQISILLRTKQQTSSTLHESFQGTLTTCFTYVSWRVPNPPGASPLVAERAPWRSSQSGVAGGQQPIGNPYRVLSFVLHT